MRDGRRPGRRLALLAVTAGLATAAASDDLKHFDSVTGFRISRYRAPTPETAPGATTVSVEDVRQLMRGENAVLIDVMPAEGAGADPRTGVWRLSKRHDHIPGSTWLADVGTGELSAEMETYFKSNLERLSGGDRSRSMIFYCLADCWMGWNAAKRAAGYGFKRVYWFPDGADGWRDWEGPLAPAVPEPLAR